MEQRGDQVDSKKDFSGHFRTTHWTVVLEACQGADPDSTEALERLCATYWYPLFAYLRRSGREAADAQDLTQSFFLHLLENNRLHSVSPAKGKFRSFLLASLRNFLANEFDRSRALKRGGQFVFIPLDLETGEARYQVDHSRQLSPDRAFEQSWALALLQTVLERLRAEYAAQEKIALFEALQTYLSGNQAAVPYAEMAMRLGVSEGAVKMAVLRLRRRFGELLREEISRTVSRPEEIDDEIRCLFAAVSG